MSSDNITSFLNSIKEIKAETVSVFLPSTSNKEDLKVLNLKQQKDIISCVADGITGLISFNRILNEIIAAAANNNSLLVIDRAPAIIALRANAHGSTYTVDDNSIDLNKIIEKFNTYTPSVSSAEFSHAGVVAKVGIPTLTYENSIISKLEAEVKKNSENNTKNLGSIYIYEIVKYVESVQYNGITINLHDIGLKDRISILEGLPLALNKQVISFIESLKREEKDIMTENGVTVEIAPSFFDVE